MNRYVVIVAGGSGTRMGGDLPKQFRDLCGRPVLWWSMKAFHEENPDTRIILVLPKDFISYWNEMFKSLPSKDQFPHQVTEGGKSRTESVTNGLRLIEDNHSLVAVHDGARPLVNKEMISRGWKATEETGAAIPVVAVTDSLRKVSGPESMAVDRSEFVAVQTPQVFSTKILKEAYQIAGDKVFTDDASVVENAGIRVVLFEGNHENMKITNPKDLVIATAIMETSDA